MLPKDYTALLLCAGYGSRISDLTQDPKSLLMINNKSLIVHHLEKISSCGIKKVHLVLGYKKEKIVEHLKDLFSDLEVCYSVNQDYRNLGNTYSMKIGMEQIQGPVVVFDADLIYEQSILNRFMSSSTENSFLVGPADMNDIECTKVLVDETGCVRKLVDKRAITAQELEGHKFIGEALGIMKYSNESRRSILELCDQFFKESENLIKNWEHLFNQYILDHRVEADFDPSDKWIEIDNREDYARAVEIFNN